MSLIRRQPALLTRIYLPAIIDPIRDWRQVRALRGRVQARRCIDIRQFFRPCRTTHHKLAMLRACGIPEVRQD